MILLHRIVELQAKTITRKTTDTQAKYDYIENLVESLKPPLPQTTHHYLISTPFRYPLPVPPLYQARWRPPYYHRNSFYGTMVYPTCVYETGYHFLRQRIHLKGLSQGVETRTHFRVNFHDLKAVDISKRKDLSLLMNRQDYSYSHNFILKHPSISSIVYPSCRNPEGQKCVCTFSLASLGKKPRDEGTLHFIYDEEQKKCVVEDPLNRFPRMEVEWEEVK